MMVDTFLDQPGCVQISEPPPPVESGNTTNNSDCSIRQIYVPEYSLMKSDTFCSRNIEKWVN